MAGLATKQWHRILRIKERKELPIGLIERQCRIWLDDLRYRTELDRYALLSVPSFSWDAGGDKLSLKITSTQHELGPLPGRIQIFTDEGYGFSNHDLDYHVNIERDTAESSAIAITMNRYSTAPFDCRVLVYGGPTQS